MTKTTYGNVFKKKVNWNVSLFFFIFLCCFSLLMLSSVQMVGDGELNTSTASHRLLPGLQFHCDGCFNTDFPILIDQPHICSPPSSNHTIDIVFFVPTSPHATARRNVIRKTWASVTKNNTSNFRHVFVIGVTSERRARMVAEESAVHRDVIVIGFGDVYYNLTLKTVASLRWVTQNCPHARFFFKVDDDVWINTTTLINRFNQHSTSLQSSLGGHCRMSPYVIRDPSAKWYASYESYPYDRYPQYCSGTGYGSSISVANQIVTISKHVPYFHMEDVYIGMCLQRAGLNVLDMDGFAQRTLPSDPCDDVIESHVTFHEVKLSHMLRVWGANCTWARRERARIRKYLLLDFLFLLQ